MALLKSNPPKPVQLEDRIDALRAEIDAEINKRAGALKESMSGVPLATIRAILIKNNPCQCAAYLHVLDSDV